VSDYDRTFDLLRFNQARFGGSVCAAARVPAGNGFTWREYSPSDAIAWVDAMSLGLLELGTAPGEAVCLLAGNSPDWLFMDLAVQQIGAVTVPIHPTASDDDYRFILTETKAGRCFVGNKELADRVSTLRPQLPALKDVHLLVPSTTDDAWGRLLARSTSNSDRLEGRRATVTPDQLSTIIFTSGTTGTPKGVMLSHGNIVSNVAAITRTIPLTPGDRALSFLPLSHSFERLVAYAYLASGAAIYLLDDFDAIREAFMEVRPHYFTAVPRLIEKQHEALEARGNSLRGFRRRLLFSALRVGLSYDENSPPLGLSALTLWLANRTVFARWRDALGGCVKLVLSGGAALDPSLIRLFNAAGMTLLEGYGMTEATTFVTVNRCEAAERRLGTVGLPIPGVEVGTADDGEILIRGPNVMMGYYQRPDLTSEAIDADGWLHSGDLGNITEGGFLELSGRKKDLFKLSGGKYIAPEALENVFKRSGLVQYIMILGENRKYVAALIVPESSALRAWCEAHSVPFEDMANAVGKPEVVELFAREVERTNQRLGKVEQVKRFALVPSEWTIAGGELSATLKVKRAVIMDRCGDLIDGCYK